MKGDREKGYPAAQKTESNNRMLTSGVSESYLAELICENRMMYLNALCKVKTLYKPRRDQ